MLSVAAFADEVERDEARQRNRDAMVRKFDRGHVAGGKVFGYRNEAILGAEGKRQHVIRVVDAEQSAVVVQIFQLCADGAGLTRIAKRLNQDGVKPPRRAHGWRHGRSAKSYCAGCISAR